MLSRDTHLPGDGTTEEREDESWRRRGETSAGGEKGKRELAEKRGDESWRRRRRQDDCIGSGDRENA